METETCSRQFCSVISREAGEDPIGSAYMPALTVIFEMARPWQRELWKSRDFPAGLYELAMAAHERGRRIFFVCVAPDPEYSLPGRRRTIVLRRPPGAFARFDWEEYLPPDGEVLPLVRAVLEEPGAMTSFASYRAPHRSGRDLLVCTHGAVDSACARFGYPIYRALRQEPDARDPVRLRVWQASHFGGHRFAATVLDLPEGRNWAHLEPEIFDLLLRRQGAVRDLHRFYRGWGAADNPLEQAAERAAWEDEGWGWIDYLKEVRRLQTGEDGEWAEVEISFTDPASGQRGRYRCRVEVSHRVETMTATGGEMKQVPQYRVVGLQRLPPRS